ncbi:MAG: hypothetical protein KBC22_01635 [Candidatus Pacebacteria bacterium]|nr:hypothetical protein [Candidatus Paceibacterota bacterium]
MKNVIIAGMILLVSYTEVWTQKSLSLFTAKIKFGIAGLIATVLGVYFVYFFLYEELIRSPFKVLYSSLELTKNYHCTLAVVSSLIAWRLISNLPFIVFNSKGSGSVYKPVMAYWVAAGLIIYTGSVIAHRLALTYLYNMP